MVGVALMAGLENLIGFHFLGQYDLDKSPSGGTKRTEIEALEEPALPLHKDFEEYNHKV